MTIPTQVELFSFVFLILGEGGLWDPGWTQTLDPWPLARIRCGLHCTQYRENFVLGVSLWYVGNGSEAGAFLKASTRGSLLHPAPVPSLQKAQSLSTQRLQEHAQVP